MLEGDYVKKALETDKLLDECLNRCNLERHLGQQVCMLGRSGSRKRAGEIEEKADGKLGEFKITPIATFLIGLCVPSGSSTEEAKKTVCESRRGSCKVFRTKRRPPVEAHAAQSFGARCFDICRRDTMLLGDRLEKLGVQTMRAGATNLG